MLKGLGTTHWHNLLELSIPLNFPSKSAENNTERVLKCVKVNALLYLE